MSIKSTLLTILGDIKITCYPPFLYYSKGDYYAVSGSDTRIALGVLRPGDIICRGYRRYLDGYFIPGKYSHTGIYIGGGMVTHAVAEGVKTEIAIQFLRCDRAIILRPRKGTREALQFLHDVIGRPYDFDFTSHNEAYYCHELAAEAYRDLGVVKKTPYLGWIRFCGMEKRYLAESFTENSNFTTILEFGK